MVVDHGQGDRRDYGAKDPAGKDPISVTLKVNARGDLVKFYLFTARGDGQRVFWPKSSAHESGHVYHLHRKFMPDGTSEVDMVISLVGSPPPDSEGEAVLLCQACGLQILMPENSKSAEELLAFFHEWNPDPKCGGLKG